MKIKNLLPVIVLLSICIVAAGLLGAVNLLTSPIILKNQEDEANKALLEVLPDGSNFSKIEITEDYPDSVTDGWKADGGYVFRMSVTGKSSGMIVMCGVSPDGKIVGTKVVSNQETPGYAAPVFEKTEDGQVYKDATLEGFSEVIVAGSTLTSRAYANAVKAALQSAILAAGGSVDTRTPEQILNDNLNAALGTEDKKFDKWFKVESLAGVDSVYTCADGYVFVIGESFVGIDSNGNVVTADATDESKAASLAAYATVKASTFTEITSFTGSEFADIVKAEVTASGNYVFEIKAKGYKYHSNKDFVGIDGGYFYIKISISAEGKIIDCVTLSHEESKGYGDVCATEDYYKQWIGATDTDIKISVQEPDFYEDQIQPDNTDIGVIASSTFTTHGYQTAVKLAFKAFDELKGDIE